MNLPFAHSGKWADWMSIEILVFVEVCAADQHMTGVRLDRIFYYANSAQSPPPPPEQKFLHLQFTHTSKHTKMKLNFNIDV